MKNKELLKRFKGEFKNFSEKDKIGMILSNAIDYGSSNGGMISGKQFDELSDTIMEFYKSISRSCAFYEQRMNLIQKYQNQLPDPYRTSICNILANGKIAP